MSCPTNTEGKTDTDLFVELAKRKPMQGLSKKIEILS
jgi:hypothetical protein